MFPDSAIHDAIARQVLRDAPIVILVLDLDGKILHVNPLFERLTGYRLEDVRGALWLDTFVPEPEREQRRARFAQVREGAHASAEVHTVLTRAGGVLLLEWTHEYLRDDEGHATGIVGIGRDVTERLAVELQYRSVVAAMHDGVVVQSATGEIIECNAAAERMLGLSAGQMMGRTSLDPRWRCVHEDGTAFPGEEHPGTIALRTGASVNDVVMGVHHPDGRVAWISVHAVPQRRPGDGVIVGNVTSFCDITATKRAEKSLREHELLTQRAQETACLGTFEFDSMAEVVSGSDELFRIFGIGRDEFLFSHFADAVHPNQREFVVNTIRTTLENRSQYDITHDLLLRDGTLKHVRAIGETVQNSEGAVLLIGTVQDVTNRVRVERMLEVKRDRLREAQRIAKLGSWELDLATNALLWSDEIFHIFEIDQAHFDASYDAFLAAVHPDDRGMVDTAFQRSVADRAPYELVHRLLMADGRVKWVEEHRQTHYDVDGRPIRSAGTVQDVTARTVADEQIRDREARLAMVFHHTTDVMVLLSVDVDGELRVAAANRGFVERISRIKRVTEADLLGRTFEELMLGIYERPFEAFAQYRESLERVIETRLPFTFDQMIAFPTGKFFAEVTVVPVRDRAGACSQLLWISHDVTAKKEAELLLRESLAEKEMLLREIHHRVKNNLQVITALLHFHSKKLHTPEDLAAFGELRQRIQAMSLLHEQLYRSPDLARINLGDYLRALVAELVRSSAPLNRVRVDVVAEDVLLPIERAMPVGMIVSELVTNVLKYAFPGDREGIATVGARLVDGRVVVGVDDDGVGFPEGFSLGMEVSFGWELVRMLVLQLGGDVEATTDRGAHVRVSFLAPVVADSARS